MPGDGFGEKLGNFFRTNSTSVFMLIWFVAQIALLGSRVVQLVGFGAGLANPALRPFTIVLTMTILYFLAVNGPIGNPKYRVPAEPGFLILLSMGYYAILDFWRRRQAARRAVAA